MEVLFYLAPIVEMANPLVPEKWHGVFVPRIQEAIRTFSPDCRSRMIVSEFFEAQTRLNGIARNGEFVAIPQKELLDNYRFNALEEMAAYQRKTGGDAFFRHVGEVVGCHLGKEYRPDVVISFVPAPFFRELYPSVILLYHEFSIFSRSPYPETFYLDPLGMGRRSSLAERCGKLNDEAVPENDVAAIADFRGKMQKLLAVGGEIQALMGGLRQKFRHVLVLPLGYERFYECEAGLAYQGQFELIEHVMDSVPGDTAVVATQHPLHVAIPEYAMERLKERYSNLVYEHWFSGVPNVSQYLVASADGCIAHSSSLAYQAVFLGKYLVSVGGFLADIADCNGLSGVGAMFGAPPKNRDPFLVRAITDHALAAGELAGVLEGAVKGTDAPRIGLRRKLDDWLSGVEAEAEANREKLSGLGRREIEDGLSDARTIDSLKGDVARLWRGNIRLDEALKAANAEIGRLQEAWKSADAEAGRLQKAWEGADAEAKRCLKAWEESEAEAKRCLAAWEGADAEVRRLRNMPLAAIIRIRSSRWLSQLFGGKRK